MAIDLEFLDFIVPIRKIEEKYPGRWDQCLVDHSPSIGGRVWHDDHLLRDGAMSPRDIEALVTRWETLGFETTRTVAGRSTWHDVCVVESMFGGPTLPCSWIEVDVVLSIAWLRGSPPGDSVGRAGSECGVDSECGGLCRRAAPATGATTFSFLREPSSTFQRSLRRPVRPSLSRPPCGTIYWLRGRFEYPACPPR